MFHKVCCS